MTEERKDSNVEFPQITSVQGYKIMAGKRKNFLQYAQAQTFVITLALTSMQDWIAYAKGQDAQGRVRPADIPSNPWTVYADELKAMTPPQKFNINTFIGCKLTRKARTPKDGVIKVAKTPKATAPAKTDVPAPKTSKTVTPYEIAQNAIQACNLKNREEFYDLKRKDMLPAGVPRKPEDTFKTTGWTGWGDFLGTGNKQAGKASVTA